MEADVYVDSLDAYNQWLQSADRQIFKPNLAAIEHAQKPQQLIKSHWQTVEPNVFLVAKE